MAFGLSVSGAAMWNISVAALSREDLLRYVFQKNSNNLTSKLGKRRATNNMAYPNYSSGAKQ